jgi:hypothetical protein
VIDVCVREHDSIEILDWNGKGSVFLGSLTAFSLKHPAVERNRVPVDVQQMTRPGDFAGRADKRNLQVLPLGGCAARKKYRQPRIVLRHKRRFPPTPAPLVEKVCERVLILTRMLR